MKHNEKTLTTIVVYSEHDKLCILEKYLNNNPTLESLVSNFIDYSLQQTSIPIEIFNELKNKITDTNTFYTVINLSISIINQTPYTHTVKNNDKNSKYIQNFKRE